MNEARPDTLLKSALEKIVYFEARSDQIQNDLAGARSEIGRMKQELGEAAQREIELRRQIAEMEVNVGRSHRERQELGARIDALMSERTLLLEKLIDGARIHDAGTPGAEESGVDLAAFISELRSEVLTARAQNRGESASGFTVSGRGSLAGTAEAYGGSAAGALLQASRTSRVAVATLAPPASVTPSATQVQAARLQSEGRLGVSEQQILALSSQGRTGRTEQTLFGFSVRELSAPDAAARIRAAERLRALGESAAAPALAAALHSEREPQVQVALLQTFAALAQGEGAHIAAPLLTSPAPDVRIAALKAMLKLEPTSVVPHLAAAARDPDPSVRRRASLLGLSLRGDAALQLSQQTTRDEDPEVRRLTVLALGASGHVQARGRLLDFMSDADSRVRRAASQTLGRLLGRDVSGLVEMDDAQRRRELRRLVAAPVAPAASAVTPAVVSIAVAVAVADVPPVIAATPVLAPAPAVSIEPLCGSLMAEIRCAIRGRTVADLVHASGSPDSDVQQACELLAARGQVIKRGLKYFTA